MALHGKALALAALMCSAAPAMADQRVLTFNSNASDPAPRALAQPETDNYQPQGLSL